MHTTKKDNAQGKILIFSAPSGSGKSTVINYLMGKGLDLHFSISATSRPPRGAEQNGVEYFFLTPEEFRQKIKDGEFIEYEEVYENRFYGTLRKQVDGMLAEGHNVVFDIDVKGAQNVKKLYGKQALSLFIQPPSIDVLRQRLEKRGTETPESIRTRMARAELELSYAPLFDKIIVNDNLDEALAEAYRVVTEFLQ